jgi:phosphatidylserine/phosphatidylglycerophosphate/cardiolipin synthase-like enzyme
MLPAESDQAIVECARELAALAASSAASIAETLASLDGKERVGVDVLNQLFAWTHPAVRLQLIELLQARGSLVREGATYRLRPAFIAGVRLALRTIDSYAAAYPLNEPAIYLTPPDLSEEVSDDVGEIHRLLVELIASARSTVTLVTPFFSEAALREILTPLEITGRESRISLTLYLSVCASELRRIQSLHAVLQNYLPAERIRFFTNVRPDQEMAQLPHAKLLLCDGARGYLGSANISLHGLHEQFEVGLRLHPRTVRAIENTLAALVVRGVYSA